MGKVFAGIGASLGTVGAMALYFGVLVGWAYWMWMSIHMGSFAMFFFGLLGPLAFPASLLGIWSFLFGVPMWLFHLVA
jgi:hypothetical protein